MKVDVKNDVALVELNRKPVNSFTMDYLEEIISTLHSLEERSDVRGLILTSVSLFPCFPANYRYRAL